MLNTPLVRYNFGALQRLLTPEWVLDNSWLKNKTKWSTNRRLQSKLRRRPYAYLTESGKALATEMAMLACIPRINYDEFAKRAFRVEPMPAGAMPIYAKTGE
jgi:hypothetical protein